MFKYLDNLFLLINKLKMDFILFGVNQTKIRQSKKSTTCNGIEQNLISTKKIELTYHEIFRGFVINQTE